MEEENLEKSRVSLHFFSPRLGGRIGQPTDQTPANQPKEEMEARAALPPPPARYYKLYGAGPDSGPAPPEPIEDGQFQQYDTFYHLGGAGGGGGVEGGAAAELKALNRETLFAFIEVVDAMANRPSESQRAHETLRECMVKMTNALSALRSTQALLEIEREYARQNAAGEGAKAYFSGAAETCEKLG